MVSHRPRPNGTWPHGSGDPRRRNGGQTGNRADEPCPVASVAVVARGAARVTFRVVDDVPDAEQALAKPDELLALHSVTERLFAMLRNWFGIGPTITLDLREIDSAVAELGDPSLIAAMAMRKLQALHLLAMPGVRTSTDVVIAMVNDLDRALLQAPSMYLALRAESTDWDAAFADLGDGAADDAPTAADDEDPEIVEFVTLHGALHRAVQAVVVAAEGEIRYFE